MKKNFIQDFTVAITICYVTLVLLTIAAYYLG